MPNKQKKNEKLQYMRITKLYLQKKIVYDFLKHINDEFIEELKKNKFLPQTELQLFIKYLNFEFNTRMISEINQYKFKK